MLAISFFNIFSMPRVFLSFIFCVVCKFYVIETQDRLKITYIKIFAILDILSIYIQDVKEKIISNFRNM
jgi:hypothetical protein